MTPAGKLNRWIAAGWLCLLWAAAPGRAAAPGPDEPDTIADFISTYEKSVVMLTVVRQDFDFVTPWNKLPMSRGVGTGFIIEGNRILTNAHNVANARYIEVVKQYEARRYPATVQFVGHDCDLALLTVSDPSFFDDTTALSFGSIPQINSTVHTCGFPVGGRRLSITEGVVSRIETGTYAHTQAHTHLIVQTDAAINPGNSGGPVLQDGRVVGVAFQGLQSADNIGYMIPTTVIDRFLRDTNSGTYDGFGTPGFATFEGLHSPAYKAFLNVPPDQTGVVVTEVIRGSTPDGILQKGDVLTRIDDYNIDNDGLILFHGLRLAYTEAIDSKLLGQTVNVTFYRDGKPQTAEVEVAINAPVLAWARMYDVEPRYRVIAGLTFVTVNRSFLESWGRNWPIDIPFSLRYLFMHANYLIDDPNRKEFVVLSEILPDDVTAYVTGFKNQIVSTINDKKINSLDDLETAFKDDLDGYWVLRFMNNDTPMILDAHLARQRHEPILRRYNVPAEAN